MVDRWRYCSCSLSFRLAISYIPDPFLRIYLATIHTDKHGSDSGAFDTEGRFVPCKFEDMWTKVSRYPHKLDFVGRQEHSIVHYDEPQRHASYIDESVRAVAVHARQPSRDGSVWMDRRVLGVGDDVFAGAAGWHGRQGRRATGA